MSGGLRELSYWSGLAALAAAAGVLAAYPPTHGWVLVVAAAVMAAVVIAAAGKVQVVLGLTLVAALVFMRPLLFGERYAEVAAGLAVAAALFAIPSVRLDRPAVAGIVAAVALWLWEFAVNTAHDLPFEDYYRGVATVLLTLLASTVVLCDERRRTAFVKGFLVVLLAVSGSAVITAILWWLSGVDSYLLGTLPGAGYEFNTAGMRLDGVPIYAPFTPTYSGQEIFGQEVPRLLGVGRESGVFATLCGVGLFLLGRVGWGRLRWQMLLVAGVLMTMSTSGFAALLVALVVSWFAKRTSTNLMVGYAKLIFTLGLLAAAAWLAYVAPGIGVEAKQTINEVSVADRVEAAQSGWAGAGSLFGEPATTVDPNAGINVLGSIVQVGLVGAALLMAGVVAPWFVSGVGRRALGPMVVLVVTVLTAQPLRYSTALLVLALVCAQRLGSDPMDGVRVRPEADRGGAAART